MRQNNKLLSTGANIVGIVDSTRARSLASKLKPAVVDFLEWRADCFPGVTLPPTVQIPWILTVRHPSEGGQGGLDAKTRRQIFHRLMDQAAAVDVETRSLNPLHDVVEAAQASRVTVIASSHHFKNTPTTNALREIEKKSRDLGADIVKIAARTETPGDVARLLGLLDKASGPLSIMGMGALGMASRVLFASCGSVLNYGWLDRPNVPGQWSARELKSVLTKLKEPS